MPKAMLVVAALALFATVAVSAQVDHEVILKNAQEDAGTAFIQWKEHHGKEYAHDSEEHQTRFDLWKKSLQTVLEHQKKNKTYELHLSVHADMSDEDFKANFLMTPKDPDTMMMSNGLAVSAVPEDIDLTRMPPKLVDWRDEGIVGPVKNQHVNNASCGCCWAFATVAIIEMKNALYTGELVTLSEQQLIDCDVHGYDKGCDGGDIPTAVNYIVNNGGLDSDEDYPYEAEDGTCRRKREGRHVVTVDSAVELPKDNETLLAQVVAHEPIVTSVCVGEFISEWRLYKGGVFNPGNCIKPIDHSVPIVGYGREHGQDYWLIKNSWGPEWGDHGYLKVPRNIGGRGQFALAHHCIRVIKEHPNPTQPAAAA